MVLLESKVSIKTDDNAPNFQLIGTDDQKHSLNDYKDYKGLLVIFMCNHCPYVKAKMEAIKEVHEKFKDTIAQFDYLVDEDQKIAKKYGAVCTPDPFLFDQNRKLIFHGRIDNAMNPDAIPTEKTMVNNIQKFLNGDKIEKDFEPSIGCSIKWR